MPARLLRTSSAIGAVKEVGEDGYEVAFTYGLFEEKSFEDCYGPWYAMIVHELTSTSQTNGIQHRLYEQDFPAHPRIS